ncbi:MAG: hypothetical protein ACLSHJ_05780 [Oscillospiraceae bacterium]
MEPLHRGESPPRQRLKTRRQAIEGAHLLFFRIEGRYPDPAMKIFGAMAKAITALTGWGAGRRGQNGKGAPDGGLSGNM